MSGTLAGVTMLALAAALAVVGGAFFGLSPHTVPAMIASSLVLIVCLAVGGALIFTATVFLVP